MRTEKGCPSRDILSGKIGQNIHPCFFVFFYPDYQSCTEICALGPFLGPRDHWGALGGPGGGLGGLQTPKMK